ncbi:hypothetical protein FQR65_LT07282 [Abscondita terminalis]|nr:hypothetical protein FQR65_LT07282 [Abscondita terminalis]
MFKFIVFCTLLAIAFAAPAPEAEPDAKPDAAPEPKPDLFITHSVPFVSQPLVYKSPVVPLVKPYSFFNVPAPYGYYPHYYF